MIKPIVYFVCFLAAGLRIAQAQAGAGYDTALTGGVYGSGGKTGAAGVFVGFYDIGGISRVVHSGAMVDLGLAGPALKKPVDGIFSVNYLTTYSTRPNPDSRQVFPFITVGYSRFFASGNAVNYGAGILWRYSRHRDSENIPGLRFEFRDFWLPGTEHVPDFRISFESALTSS